MSTETKIKTGKKKTLPMNFGKGKASLGHPKDEHVNQKKQGTSTFSRFAKHPHVG